MTSLRKYSGATLALTGLLTVGLVAVSPTTAQAATSQTFTADGTFTVPTGVTSLNFVVTGAGGGSAPSAFTTQPGVGGAAAGSLAVAAGDVLTVQVGGLGGSATAVGGSGGSHGGAQGGDGAGAFGEDQGGGGGGGYSALLSGPTVLAVGGGGGGAAAASAGGNGAESGAGAVGVGLPGANAAVLGGTGGGGGGASAGGVGGTNANCSNAGSEGANGIAEAGGSGGDGGPGCALDASGGGGGGGGGLFGGGGGGGGYWDPFGSGENGGGGGGAGSSYINPAFGTGTFSAAPTVAAGSVVLSWSTEKATQVPVGCGAAPKKIARNGTTVLTKAGCTTNAKQKVSVTASCKLRTRGDVGYCRVIRGKNGKVSIRTYGYSLTVKVRWSAPGTQTYKAYVKTKTYSV